MTKDEVIKQALDALEKATDTFLDTEGNHGTLEQDAIIQCYAAIQACRAALAEQDSEPVAWLTDDGRVCTSETKSSCMPNQVSVSYSIPLYTAPQPQPLTVPQGWKLVPVEPTDEMTNAAEQVCIGSDADWHNEYMRRDASEDVYRAMLAAAPEAAAVQPLTDEQKLDIVTNWFTDEADITRAMQMLIDFEQTTPAANGIGAPKE